MLRNLLTRFYFEDYVPHVRHVFYPALLVAAGWRCLLIKDWEGFGLIYISGGVILFLVIVLGIAWRGPIEYWDKIAEAIKALLRAGITPLEAKKILGLSVDIPETVKIKEYVDRGAANSFPGIRYKEIPATEAIMLNEVSNKVLMSKTIDFTETLYSRKVLKYFKEKGYVVKESKHPKAKHILNHKGLQIVNQFASSTIKEQLKKEENNA